MGKFPKNIPYHLVVLVLLLISWKSEAVIYSPEFNEACYLARYPALVQGWVNKGHTAYEHWIRHGQYESRKPGCIVPEVKPAIVQRVKPAVVQNLGDFNEACYLARYPALVQGWVNKGHSAYEHWTRHGQYESRNPSCTENIRWTGGHLNWRPGGEINKTTFPICKAGSPDTISQSLVSASKNNASHSIEFGFNNEGGGYINSFILRGYDQSVNGRNLTPPQFGKGIQGSLRDRLHNGRYNPTQAGYNDKVGTPVVLTKRANYVSAQQFTLALYGDPVFDFLSHETSSIVDVYKNDTGNSDSDYYAGDSTLDSELRSEFDYSFRVEDASSKFGLSSFLREEYYIYARAPSAIYQFTDPRSVVSDGSPVLKTDMRIADISNQPANQTPRDTDLSYITHSVTGARLDSEFRYFHYRQGQSWVTGEVSADTPLNCEKKMANEKVFRFAGSNKVVTSPSTHCNLDQSLMILSNSPNPFDGTAVGVYFPLTHVLNKKQVSIFDKGTRAVAFSENRRLGSLFQVVSTENSRYKYSSINVRSYLSGLLSPTSASAYYGGKKFEGISSAVYFLVGTPEEILQAVRKCDP